MHLLAKIPGIRIDEYTGLGHMVIPMHTDVSPFDNNDLRLALKLAIDREEILKRVFHGHAAIANDHPISPRQRFFASELPQREYDPDKAKYHLKKAGYNTITVSLSVAEAGHPQGPDTAVLYKEHAKKAGININVIREPNDGYFTNVWLKKPWCISFWRGRSTEGWMFTAGYQEGGAWNESHFKHERFNKLLLEARAERDDNKRREMYVEMQRIVRDEGGTVIPVYINHIMACIDKLQHGPFLGYADLDGYKLPERWWFA